jgi:glutamine amidotransferase
MIKIVNYGSGNISAIGNIYDRLNIKYEVADTPNSVKGAQKIILPGVGAFDETMGMLNKSGFRDVLEELVLGLKVPILGICVGMQILSEGSEEGNLGGLGWINGHVRKIDKNLLEHKPKLPHLGWNSIEIKKYSPLLENVEPINGFYFIHSYYFECADEGDELTSTYYGKYFSSSVNKENITGVQFHPEKSHHNGIAFLRNFSQL